MFAEVAAIKSENIRAVRHLEIFLGQTLHFIDKETESQIGEGSPEVPVMCEGLVLCGSTSFFCFHLLAYLKGWNHWLGSSLFKSPLPPLANSCWEGLGLWSPSPASPVGTQPLLCPLPSLSLS